MGGGWGRVGGTFVFSFSGRTNKFKGLCSELKQKKKFKGLFGNQIFALKNQSYFIREKITYILNFYVEKQTGTCTKPEPANLEVHEYALS